MLWRVRPSVRSLLHASQRRRSSSRTAHSPLRVLFCGADEFSIASLRALEDAKQTDRKLIESIEVVHRPGKRTGRGLKVVRDGMELSLVNCYIWK
jgi:methionyl-tRNA formyltransferase